MTITFPRDWPAELDLTSMPFELVPMVEVTPLRSGKQIALDLGPSLWSVEASSVPLGEEDFGRVRALFDTLSSLEAINVYDHLREYPLRYAGGWPAWSPAFDGTCDLVDVSEDTKTVSLDGLPEEFELCPGDYVGWPYDNDSQALHRVSAGGIASGGLLGVEVRPFIRPVTLSPFPIVSLYRASCRMIVVPGSLKMPTDGDRLGRATFRLIQTL